MGQGKLELRVTREWGKLELRVTREPELRVPHAVLNPNLGLPENRVGGRITPGG
jgi:hypothetical protein